VNALEPASTKGYTGRRVVPLKETRPMDVLKRVNVLAVCAAFVFVGAVVLGAI
jgi:hypothetical protein